MGKLTVNKQLLTDESGVAAVKLCPFNAISYENGKLDISSGCKMCKMCVKKSKGLIEYTEETVEAIDK